MKTIKIILALICITFSLQAKNPAIYVEKGGEGSAMLFLPGFSAPSAVWDETIQNLKGDHKIYTVSYAGFNGLAAIEMPWYNTIKEELIAYMKKESLSDIIIVGHSMGGMLALDIASTIPDKVKDIVIIDALTCMRELMMPGVPKEAIQYESMYNKQMLNQTDSARKSMAYLMSSNMTLKPEKVALLVQWNLAADKETFVYGYTDLLKLDLRPELSKITARALIIAAPFPNKEIVTKSLDEQYANLVQKDIVVATNSRHYIMFDQPKWFYEQLNTFLAN